MAPQGPLLLTGALLKAEQTHLFLDTKEPFSFPWLRCAPGAPRSPASGEMARSDEARGRGL